MDPNIFCRDETFPDYAYPSAVRSLLYISFIYRGRFGMLKWKISHGADGKLDFLPILRCYLRDKRNKKRSFCLRFLLSNEKISLQNQLCSYQAQLCLFMLTRNDPPLQNTWFMIIYPIFILYNYGPLWRYPSGIISLGRVISPRDIEGHHCFIITKQHGPKMYLSFHTYSVFDLVRATKYWENAAIL